MVRQASLLSDLESITGGAYVHEPDDTAFAVDGVIPSAIVQPGSYEEVAEVMRYATAMGLAVIPWGGGTLMHIGNTPRAYHIAISLTRLNAIVEYEPADLTVTCHAGMTLADLQCKLDESRQTVPFGLLYRDDATIGGLLAANYSGPERHAYGTPRDFTIGLRVVTADGRITRAGGKVVKNVAGYDLCKLYIGSLGTLGVIVEATFKVQPSSKTERTIALAFRNASDACALASEFHRRGLSVRAIQLLSARLASSDDLGAPRGYILALDLAGGPLAVDRSAREIQTAAGRSATSLPQGSIAPARLAELTRIGGSPSGEPLVCKLSLLPSAVATLINDLEACDHPPYIAAYPASGVAHAGWLGSHADTDTIDNIRAIVARLGGSVILEHCPPHLKVDIDVFGELPSSFALMRCIKQQFDPKGILSPGRFVGRL